MMVSSSEGCAGRMPSSEGGAVRSEMGSGRPWLNKSLASVREQVGYIFYQGFFYSSKILMELERGIEVEPFFHTYITIQYKYSNNKNKMEGALTVVQIQ